MRVRKGELPGTCLFELDLFHDERGYFFEAFRESRYAAAGIPLRFVQDNVSFSKVNVLRGLHYQHPHGQGKLISVLDGEIYDVSVDLRRDAKTFGRWQGFHLSRKNRLQVFLPAGLAHGFCVLSDAALVLYKCTEAYHPEDERGVLWNDPDIGIEWPISSPVISARDAAFPRLSQIPQDHLPSLDESSLAG